MSAHGALCCGAFRLDESRLWAVVSRCIDNYLARAVYAGLDSGLVPI